jgi:UDPglucose 6-dehydrogenase
VKVGFVGLGKLGLPVALAIEAAGHEVCGWDVSQTVQDTLRTQRLRYVEEGAQELLDETKITLMEPDMLAEWADLIFVAVQTPHQPEFEGITRLPDERADFNYEALKEAVASVDNAKLVVVISTVLPGTVQRELFDDMWVWIEKDRLLYNPFFIAMGTTIPDFREPEFVLIGTDGVWPGPLEDLYESIHSPSVMRFVTTIRTAELTKVAYNTFIGLKIAFANTMMELCEKTGADVDDLVDALCLGTKRILSPAYMRGGMGDGGGCHPRDNIALSWLAREHSLSYDLFEALMLCREQQTAWLATHVHEEWLKGREVEILGKAYKPGTALTVGSPALLLANILDSWDIEYRHTDPYADSQTEDRISH